MKIQVNGTPATKPKGGEWWRWPVALLVFLTLGGLCLWWLVPTATAGAIDLSFSQAFALAVLLPVTRVLWTATTKPK